MERVKKLYDALEVYVKPLTTPVAVRLCEDIVVPERAKRPSVQFGCRMGLCQGFSFARRYGWSTVFTIEDLGCGPALSYFGMIDRPEFQREGGLVYPMYAKTKEGAKRSEDAMDVLPQGKIHSICIEPVSRMTMRPDLVLIYGNAAQMARLIQGALYCEGGGIAATMTGRCACVPEIVTPYLRQDYNLSVPDGGERIFGLTQDDELVFTVPYCKIEDCIEGLTATHKSGVARYPFPPYGLRMEPQFPAAYAPLVALADQEIQKVHKEKKQ